MLCWEVTGYAFLGSTQEGRPIFVPFSWRKPISEGYPLFTETLIHGKKAEEDFLRKLASSDPARAKEFGVTSVVETVSITQIEC